MFCINSTCSSLLNIKGKQNNVHMKLSAKDSHLYILGNIFSTQWSTFCTKYRKYKWGIDAIFFYVICISLMERCYRLNPVTMKTTKWKHYRDSFWLLLMAWRGAGHTLGRSIRYGHSFPNCKTPFWSPTALALHSSGPLSPVAHKFLMDRDSTFSLLLVFPNKSWCSRYFVDGRTK